MPSAAPAIAGDGEMSFDLAETEAEPAAPAKPKEKQKPVKIDDFLK